jgi:hypothetical protein
MLRGAIGWFGCLLVAALCGCSPHLTHAPPSADRPAPTLPATSRRAIEPDVSQLPLDTIGQRPTRPAEYRRLSAADCRLLAIRNAPLADDLDHHPDNSPANHPHFHPLRPTPEEADRTRLVRGHAADELRNRAAGEALDEYFQLARAEGQFDLLAAVDRELRAQLAAAEAAEKQGLRDRADIDAIRVQLFDTEAQAARLEAAIGSLNASLRARLGLAPDDTLPLWPDDPLAVRPDEVNIEEAVRTGRFYRPDLNLLRTIAKDDGTASAELTRAVLTGINPLLASPPNPLVDVLGGLSKKPGKGDALRRQVASALVGRERQAEAEIRAAVLTLHGHRAAATAKAAEVRRLTAKVAELQKMSATGLQVAAELTKARLDLLKARGDLLQAATDWNAAEVKLRQAMGLLVREGP